MVYCVVLATTLSLLSSGAGAAATTNCVALEVRTAQWDSDASTLMRVDLTGGTASTVARLSYRVNAIGYAPQQNVVYGIATRGGDRLARISTRGSLSDLGQVRGAHGGLSDAVLGSDLYVSSDGMLYAIGAGPSSGDFGSMTRRVSLRPEWLADGVDDFAVNDSNGLLYGVAGSGDGAASVVSVDPGSGAPREVRVVQGLPGWANYGSVVVAGQIMYAIEDDVFGQSRLYRIPLDGSGPAIQLASWSSAEITDLAGCLATPVPPSTPPPPPPPTTTHQPPHPPPASSTTTSKPLPVQVIPPPKPPTTTTVAATTPTPPPPTPPVQTGARATLSSARTLAQASDKERNIERRWALTVVVVLFGGGAVAARRARQGRASRDSRYPVQSSRNQHGTS